MSTPPTDDSDLRCLFDDAVSDVHPEGGTSEIRARAGRPSARRWVPLTARCCRGDRGRDRRGGVAGPATAGRHTCRRAGRTPSRSPREPALVRRRPTGTRRSRCRSTTWVAPLPDRACSPRRTGSPTRRGASCRWRCRRSSPGHRSTPTTRTSSAGWASRATADANGGEVTIDLSEPLSRPPGMNEEQAQMAVQSLVWTADAAAPGQRPGRVHRRRCSGGRGARHRHVRTGGARQW